MTNGLITTDRGRERDPNAIKLADIMPRFLATDNTIRNKSTRDRYLRAVRFLDGALGHESFVSDLSDDNLALLTHWLEFERNQIPRTVNGTLTSLIKVWKWCQNKGLLRVGPTVKPLRVPKKIPKAFTDAEVQALVRGAQRMPGSIAGMPASVFWLTVLQLVLNTGSRTSELLQMRWEWIDWSTGWMRVPSSVRKGQVSDAVYALWPETIEWLKPLAKPTGSILNWRLTDFRFWQLWDKLLQAAGIEGGRHRKTQCLRRTFGTAIHWNGGDASAALGHSNPALAMRHYIDPVKGQDRRHADVIPANLRPLSIIRTEEEESGAGGREGNRNAS